MCREVCQIGRARTAAWSGVDFLASRCVSGEGEWVHRSYSLKGKQRLHPLMIHDGYYGFAIIVLIFAILKKEEIAKRNGRANLKLDQS